MYKNQLQELAQRSCFNLPSYSCIREGPDHAPRFKATVNFNGETFESPTFCSTLRQAEHAAAEVALSTLAEHGPSRALAARVLDETGVYKNLLQETAHRAGLKLPVYTTVRSGPGHVPIFSCTVELAGMSFTGESARTKKQAQKNAAMAAWSALRKMSQSRSSSLTPPLDAIVHEEPEQVTIARILASLQPSESNKSSENYQRHGQQRSTPILWESTWRPPSLYPMQYQNWAYSGFSPEVAMFQIWQQEQLLQHQNQLLALTVPAATPSDPRIYPLMQSMLQPDHYLYFPGRELDSFQMRPRITISTPSPSFCFSNHLVSSSISGRSTVTIQEIPEEKPEESSNHSPSGVPEPPNFGHNNSAEPQILETVQVDDKQNLGGLERNIKNLQLEGNQRGNFEWASHRSMVSGFKPIDFHLQNQCIDSSRPNPRSQCPPVSPGIFKLPSSAAAPVNIRTVGPTSTMEVRPQYLVSPGVAPPRMRSRIPSCSTRPSERLNLGGVSTAFMAPAVRIRSVVPVCSAPPVRKTPSSSNDAVSLNTERKI